MNFVMDLLYTHLVPKHYFVIMESLEVKCGKHFFFNNLQFAMIFNSGLLSTKVCTFK